MSILNSETLQHHKMHTKSLPYYIVMVNCGPWYVHFQLKMNLTVTQTDQHVAKLQQVSSLANKADQCGVQFPENLPCVFTFIKTQRCISL